MTTSLLLIVGAILFTLSASYFFINRKKYQSDLPWLVSFITIISYLVMIMNVGASADPASMLWTRWIGYGMSCTFLTASMIALFNVQGKNKLTALVSTPLIMLTGVLAAIATNATFLILFFAIGIIPFLVLIAIFRKTANAQNKSILNYVYFGWMAFPVIFILSPETFSIIPSLPIALGGYLIADMFTKIVFYMHINKITS